MFRCSTEIEFAKYFQQEKMEARFRFVANEQSIYRVIVASERVKRFFSIAHELRVLNVQSDILKYINIFRACKRFLRSIIIISTLLRSSSYTYTMAGVGIKEVCRAV